MCASIMFNTSIDPSIMDFDPPIKSNHLLATSPTFSNLLHNNQQIPMDATFMDNSPNNSQQHSFNPHSPPYIGNVSDDLRACDYKKKVSKHCLVCGEPAFYFFYGSLCCDACRTFFRRSSLQNSKHLKCPFNGKCVINNRTRKDCSKCRLDKCLEVGMRQDLIVNAKEERKRKQSINLYDFPFNNALNMNSASTSAPNLYSLTNNFANNFSGLSAIQSEYDQYRQFYSLNYANAYYMHNSLNGFSANNLNSLKTSTYTQSTTQPSINTIDNPNPIDTLNSLNQLNYSSPVNQFMFNNENSNNSIDANYLTNSSQLIHSPPSLLHSSGNSSFNLLESNCASAIRTNPQSDKLDEVTNFIPVHHISSQRNHLNNQLTFNQLPVNSSPNYSTGLDDLSSEQLASEIKKLIESKDAIKQIRTNSNFTNSDENAKDGFDRYLSESDYDKLDLSKLDLNKLDLNKSEFNKPSLSSSLSSSSSCSSSSSHTYSTNQLNSFGLEHIRLMKNCYNWKKRKIHYLNDLEIEKENRKVFRTLARQSELVKRQRLDEILKASKRIMKLPDYKLNDCTLSAENSISRGHLLEALKWQFFGITKLCKVFQEISAYKMLDEIEKKYLLMENCTYILMLSSTKYYNFDTNRWDINVKLNDGENKRGERIKMPVPVEVMDSGSKKELASYYIEFMKIFDRSWLEDEILMTLIFVISLFTPNEKLIKKINNIKYEHECYLSLLEDYLAKKLESAEKVKLQTNLIKQFLAKLTEFKEMFETAHVVLAKEEASQLYRHLTEQLAV